MSRFVRTLGLAATVAAAACTRARPSVAPPTAPPHPPTVPDSWPLFREAHAVSGAHGMVVSGAPLASRVGADILRAGGNAVDAAVAVGFALAVVHPEAGNIGGGGFMVIRLANGHVTALDYRETAPAGATPGMYLDAAGRLTHKSITGALAVGVPGSVAGLVEAHRRFGRLPFDQVIAPAIRLARDGFVLDRYHAGAIAAGKDRLALFPASAKKFLVDGKPPVAGTRFVQPDLAKTLQAIADSGAAAFYQGHIADLIAAEMRRDGGLITKADLATYRPIWREPVRASYRGYRIYSMPPSSSGGVTLTEILNILEGYRPFPAFGTARYAHLLAEAMRRAFVDRNQYLGDPAFVTMPLARLESKAYAAALRRGIAPDRATPTTDLHAPLTDGNQTTHYSVVDSAGDAVSVTTTLNSGFGSAVTVAGGGFLLNNEMDDFTAAPGQPNQYGLVQGEANAIRPGKRMLSAMTPTIVLDPHDSLFLVVGTPGGPTIITTVAQVIMDVIDQHMPLTEAVAAPRLHHQGLPDRLYYEKDGLSKQTTAALEAMGYHLSERRGYSGDVAAIERSTGGWVGVADPRADGGAVGY